MLSHDKLRANLAARGITGFSEEDFESLYSSICDSEGKATAVYRYAKGHLFTLNTKRSALHEQIAKSLGNLSKDDLVNLDLF